MSGKPGRSGGARAGAGHPPKTAAPGTKADGKQEPLDYLLAVMNDNEADPVLRVRSAIAAAQYRHTKRSDGGKKDEKQKAAELAELGKFKAAAAPKLVVNNR